MAALWPERVAGRWSSVSGYLIGSQAGRQDAAAARGRAAVVVPVLLRDRARRAPATTSTARLRQADLAAGFAEVELRRRHLRAQRRRLRQPGPRGHHDPQLPLAPGPGRGRGEVRRAREAPRHGADHRRPDHHAWKATPTARRTPSPAPTPASSPGRYEHRDLTGGIGHNLPQEAPEAFAQAVLDVDKR